MGVHVDTTGDDVLPAGIDDALGAPPLTDPAAPGCQGDDLLTLDENIGLDLIGSGDHQPTPHHDPPHAPRPISLAAADSGGDDRRPRSLTVATTPR
ncbi:hypothetical protein GCM10010417_08580 [Streptomyces carpaticus]